MYLVVGATGLVGHEVALALARDGDRVRAITRRSDGDARVAALRAGGVEVVRGDLKDPASIAGACRGARVVDSLHDVVRYTVAAARGHQAARNAVVELGGPDALSPLDAVRTFERVTGRRFEVEHVPDDALRGQFQSASDATQKSFAALMLGYAAGDAIPMADTSKRFGIEATPLETYARAASGGS